MYTEPQVDAPCNSGLYLLGWRKLHPLPLPPSYPNSKTLCFNLCFTQEGAHLPQSPATCMHPPLASQGAAYTALPTPSTQQPSPSKSKILDRTILVNISIIYTCM